MSCTVNYVPGGATHDDSTGLLAQLTGGTLTNYKIVLPDTDTTTWTFAGYVTAFIWPWTLRMSLHGDDHESPLVLLGGASGGQLLGDGHQLSHTLRIRIGLVDERRDGDGIPRRPVTVRASRSA